MSGTSSVNFRLAKSIILNESIPHDMLSESPEKLYSRLANAFTAEKRLNELQKAKQISN